LFFGSGITHYARVPFSFGGVHLFLEGG
jgi:hypothetical protein